MPFIKSAFQACIISVFPVLLAPVETAAHNQIESGDTVKIGLLVSDGKSQAAKEGAELAVLEANGEGGLNGLPLKLVVSSMEGPWGTGSKQAVRMVFDEKVAAILGSHDGRNAHLVEQVAAKSRIVFLSAWSGDPTLSQAFVPWFFNCVYNDIQISDLLIREIYDKRKYMKIALISDSSYDSGSVRKNFLKKVESEGKPEPLSISYRGDSQDIRSITDKLKSEGINCIVLFGQPPASLKIVEQLRVNHLNQPVYGPLYLLDENKISIGDMKNYKNVAIVASELLSGEIGISFSKNYEKTYGRLPGAVASYAYDGMNVLIAAIRKGGTEREKLQRSFSEIKYEGVTGTIQFDERGNRKGIPVLVEIKNGIPVPVK